MNVAEADGLVTKPVDWHFFFDTVPDMGTVPLPKGAVGYGGDAGPDDSGETDSGDEGPETPEGDPFIALYCPLLASNESQILKQ